MDHIRVLQELVHRSIHRVLVVMVVDGGADEVRFPCLRKLQLLKDLPGQLRSFVGVIIVASRTIGMQVVEHPRHGSELRVQPPLLRQHGRRQRHSVKMRRSADPLLRIGHAVKLCVDILPQILQSAHKGTSC